jgi:MFS family permease
MVDYRWIILGVLFIARFCLGFQFQSAGSIGPFLIDQFQLDYRQVGTLVGLFMLPGLIVSIPVGVMGKRYGDKRVVMVGICTMIAGGIVCALATSYVVVIIGRMVSGVGAVFLVVLMTKMITDWFADREMFIGMSIFIIGWPVGIAAAQATQGQLAQMHGWASVFGVTAAMLGVALACMAMFYRPAPIAVPSASIERSSLSRNEVALICIAGATWMFLNCAYVVLLSLGPVFLVERGAPVVEASRAVSLMSWVFLFALPLGGYLATRFKAPNQVMVIGLVGSLIFGALIPFASAPKAMFVLFGVALALATPVIGSLPSEALRSENRATGLGVYYLWYYGGVAVAPAVGGVLKDVTKTAATSIHFATAMIFACLCLLGYFRLRQRRAT